MYNALPLWTSHYSIGSSILTLENPKDKDKPILENGPKSIIQICSEAGLSELFLVESSMSGFVKALKGSQENNLKLVFGLKVIVCSNIEQKDNNSLSTQYKIIIFAKNDDGYRVLKKIYTLGATRGFYYYPRIDCSILKDFWSPNLVLAHPFYHSFLHRNLMYFANCNPQLDFISPQNFFVEKNQLPFNYLIEKAIDNYSKENKINIVNTKTIYYLDEQSYKSFVTNRAIHNRKTLNCPDEEHLSSSEFSFETWRKNESKIAKS